MAKLESTSAPDDQVKPVGVAITGDKLREVGNVLWDAISQAMGDRSELRTQLEEWNSLYEMEVDPIDWPWPDASNVFIPFIPTQLDTLQSRLAALVYQPRLYLVEGTTPIAAQFAHEVEMYYNAGLARHDRRRSHYDLLHLGLRDGFAAMDVTWRRLLSKRTVETAQPSGDAEMPELDPQTGEIKIEWKKEEITVIDYNDYVIDAVELKDLLWAPASAQTLDDAALVARRMLFMETDLRAMCQGDDPELDSAMVEGAIAAVSEGMSELPHTDSGTDTYEAGGLLNVSGSIAGGTYKRKTYARQLAVFRVNTNIFDVDGDGWPEEAVAWIHESTGKCLGIRPYRYLHGKRSLVGLTPIPRAKRLLGMSLVSRLAPIQLEINSTHNARNNQIELRLSPPRYKKDGAKINTKDGKWGPDVEYDVQSPDDVGLIFEPPIPIDSYQQEMLLQSYGQNYTGLSNPMTGGQSTGRRSAKEIGVQQQSAGIRIDLMATQVRETERQIFEQIHALTKQYGSQKMQAMTTDATGKPTQLTIEKEKLVQDYLLSVAGLGAPLDQQSRMQERMFVFSLLKDIPYIAQNQVLLYRLVRFLTEATGVSDLTSIIGTEQDAMARQQQDAQQQQQQAQQQQVMQHLQMVQAAMGQKPGAPEAQPQAQPKPQQPGQPPQQAQPKPSGFGPKLT